MADNTSTSKKSGFSFRKKRSNSKTRKDDTKPVDIETEERVNEMEINKTIVQSTADGGESAGSKEVQHESQDIEEKIGQAEGETIGTLSSGEDSSPKGIRNDESPEEITKKKSKRRPRSLFRRSSKNKDAKNSEKSEETSESATKEEIDGTEECHEAAEASNRSVNVAEKQVVCDETEKQSEITTQSDTEYGGGASEVEGEVFGEKDDEQDDQTKVFVTADKMTDDGKKGEQKDVTKKKGFFKRGLSLRKSKAKKKRNSDEVKDEKAVETCEIGVSTDSKSESNTSAIQTTEIDNIIVNDTDDGEQLADLKPNNDAEVSETPMENTDCDLEDIDATIKEAPAKPIRKVSFVEPDYDKEESTDEGDSPSEDAVETGDDMQDATSNSTSETSPSETMVVDLEVTTESKDVSVSEVVPNPKAETDEDDLTEVSSVTSSLLASSDVPSQVETEETQPSVFADTEETGSRITLVESGEIGEGSGTEQDVDAKESEDDKLLEEPTKEKKDGEWIMLNQSNDMSVELQRVRKQTLFGVKRLCCSVM